MGVKVNNIFIYLLLIVLGILVINSNNSKHFYQVIPEILFINFTLLFLKKHFQSVSLLSLHSQ